MNFSFSTLFLSAYSCLFIFSSFVIAAEKDSFIYIIEKTDTYLDNNQMLVRSLEYMHKKSDPDYLSHVFSLEENNKNYIYEQLEFNKTFTPISQNLSFFTDIDRFIKNDIWEDLENSNNREQSTDEYIELGEVLLSSSSSQVFTFSAQQKGLKQEVSKQKKEVSKLIKEYKKSLNGWDSEKIEKLQVQIIEKKEILIHNELEFEKTKAYIKRLKKSEKELQQRVRGAQENRDALIKNVRVQESSGKFIDAIE